MNSTLGYYIKEDDISAYSSLSDLGYKENTEEVEYPLLTVEYINMQSGLCYRKETIGGIEMVKVPVSISYLSEEDFKTQDTQELEGKFLDEGVIIPAKETRWNREQFKIGVQFVNGMKRIVNLNNTSRSLLTSFYGEDSKEWIGKEVICKGAEEMVGKNMRFVVYVRPKALKP